MCTPNINSHSSIIFIYFFYYTKTLLSFYCVCCYYCLLSFYCLATKRNSSNGAIKSYGSADSHITVFILLLIISDFTSMADSPVKHNSTCPPVCPTCVNSTAAKEQINTSSPERRSRSSKHFTNTQQCCKNVHLVHFQTDCDIIHIYIIHQVPLYCISASCCIDKSCNISFL